MKRKWLILSIVCLIMMAMMTCYAAGFERITGIWDAVHLGALFTLVYAVTLILFTKMNRCSILQLIFVSLFVGLSMMARLTMLDYNSADYDSFLMQWVEQFRTGGFKMLGENVGDYNLLYQYILLLVSKSPLHDLYMIKYVTIVFDYALALAMMRAAGIFCSERARLPVFLILTVLPTTLLGGSFWGQCDSVYAFLVIMCLCDLKTVHPCRSAAFLSLAFAFKLQTIFIFPVVLLALIHKEYKIRHAAVFALVYLLTMVPALAAGRSFIDAISVYASQSIGQYYHRLTYNAPNLYIFFPMVEFASTYEYTWMRYIKGIEAEYTNPYLTKDLFPTIQTATLYACILLTLLVVIYWLRHKEEITPEMTLRFALFFAIFLPFVMPKIHDRYFYLADMLSILYAFRYKKRGYVPALVIGASFMSYMVFLTRQRPVDERVLALMMFAALLIVAHDLLSEMRNNRKVLQGGKMV